MSARSPTRAMLVGVLVAGAAAIAAWLALSPIEVSVPVVAVGVGGLGFAAGVFVGARSGPRAEPERADEATESGALDTARHALEAAQLESTRARAELDGLQRSVAHDLRSPFAAVLNFVMVLLEDHGKSLSPGARGIVERIRHSAESGLTLLDGLSRLSRIGRAPFHPEPLEVETVVREALAELRSAGCSIEVSVGPLPRTEADPFLLRAALTELLANAAKFSAGREEREVRVGGRIDPDGTRVYWVADDGVGFDMHHAGKLFGVFERLHSREEFPGAGVGLAIVKRVAERHAGRVWAEGAPDAGARFFVALPATRGISS